MVLISDARRLFMRGGKVVKLSKCHQCDDFKETKTNKVCLIVIFHSYELEINNLNRSFIKAFYL